MNDELIKYAPLMMRSGSANFTGRSPIQFLLALIAVVFTGPGIWAQSVSVTEFTIPTSASQPQGIVTGPDGALWFTEQNGNKIGRVTTSGGFSEYALPTAGNDPYGIALGPDGALWFTESSISKATGKIGRITTAGAITEFPLSSGTQPQGIVAGPDGALWFADASGYVGRITTAGVITRYTIASQAWAITRGPDGALWFTENAKIGRITTAGVITEYAVPGLTDLSFYGIAAGSDGALWFGADTSPYNQVARITTAGVVTVYDRSTIPPFGRMGPGITSGPDGALWYTDYGGNALGRITTAGAITEYAVPSFPEFITVGPDGALWFTEFSSKIGRAALVSGNPVPTLSSLSPPSAIAGGASFTLTANGSSFVSGSTVQWNGSPRSTTFISSTQLQASISSSDIASAGAGSVTVFNPAPAGGISNALAFAINAVTPSLSSLSPNSAIAGGSAFTLTANGSSFLSGASILWNGSALPTSYISSSQLSASVSASLIASQGSASVTVQNPGGTTSGALTFVINAPTPSLSGVSPTSATAGGPAFTLTVSGSGFLNGSTVRWNGSSLTTNYVNSGQLTASVSVSLIASQGSASITVLNPGGATSNALTFTISAPTPSISGLSPSSATAGGPAFTLAVNGSGFLSGATVLWNGSSLTTAYVSGNQVMASVGANLIVSPGSATVTVMNPGGATSNGASFTINAPTPSISGLSPSSATAGGPALTLTVNGSGFLVGSAVQWNGSALTTSYVSSNQLTAAVSANLIVTQGTENITVVNPGGASSNSVTFTINPPTPTISSLSPNSATAGGPQFTLIVNGSGFLVGSTVQWNGSSLSTSYGSGSQLTVTVSASLIANTGSASVTVLNPGGATSGAMTFTINPPTPTISSLSPNSAAAGGAAFTLTVNGSGFLSGSTVQWNGSALATSYVNGSQLTASISANLIASAGSATVTVVNPGGATSNSVTFTINTAGSLSITTASPLPAGTVGAPYSQALAATGGVTPYKSWMVISGNPPPGISLTTLGGVLTSLLNGVPTTPGTFTFTVQVTDNANATTTKQFSLTINGGALSISAAGIVNAASYAGGSVSAGEILAIFGSDLGPSTLEGLQLDSRGYVSSSLAGTQVLFDGVAAPMIYSQAGQVSVVVPYEVTGKSTTQVQVVYQGQSSNMVSMPVSTVMPGIFTIDASGHGPGAILNQDGTVNSASNPASVGSYIFVYATGEGQTNPGGIDGKPGDSPAPLPVAQPVTATVGGLTAQVQYAGGVPGLVAGVLQVNVQVPTGVATGSSVPVVISVGGQSSQANVTVAIK